MADSNTSKVFWILGGFALLWNLMGVGAFISQMSMSAQTLAALSQSEQDLYAATPSWVNVAFGVAVIGGAIGCVLLLMKKSASHYVLWLSLIGVLVQMSYVFFVSKAFEIYGPGQAVMPIMVIIVAIVLVWYSKRFTQS